jgi:hypothetical protein
MAAFGRRRVEQKVRWSLVSRNLITAYRPLVRSNNRTKVKADESAMSR